MGTRRVKKEGKKHAHGNSVHIINLGFNKRFFHGKGVRVRHPLHIGSIGHGFPVLSSLSSHYHIFNTTWSAFQPCKENPDKKRW
jgi:hypothetical protein